MLRTQQDQAFAVTQAGPDDSRRVSDFITGLSVRTQFLRFFASVAPPSSSLLRALTGADGRADVLVAVDGDGTIVGHGMAVDRPAAGGEPVHGVPVHVRDQPAADGEPGHGVPVHVRDRPAAGGEPVHGVPVHVGDQPAASGGLVSDVGLVVADDWQLRGVGSALLDELSARAQGRGVGDLVMDVLADNRRMRAMIDRRWPGACRDLGGDSITYRVPLTTGDARAAS